MMNLYFQHGRRFPDQELKDWGENGPILPNCIGVHSIYGELCAYFASRFDMHVAQKLTGWERADDNALQMKFSKEFVIAKFMDGETGYFGDWGLAPMTYFNQGILAVNYDDEIPE